MKITIRLGFALILVVAAVTLAFSLYQVDREKQRLTADVERRSVMLVDSLQESIIQLVQTNSIQRLNRLVNKLGNRERLRGIAVFDVNGNLLTSTQDLKLPGPTPFRPAVDVLVEKRTSGKFIQIDGENTYVSVTPIADDDTDIIGVLAIFNDTSYFDARLAEILKDNIIRFFIVSILVALSTVIVVRWSVTGPIANLAESMKKMRLNVTGGKMESPLPERGNVLDPIISEVANLARSLSTKEEARGNPQKGPFWTKASLKEYMTNELNGKRLFLVSNREPYIHEKESDTIRCIVPAGGLVTALDPVMKACEGVWIAHGSGNADRETADALGRIQVPPDNPAYRLRRVWLSKEQEAGYYYGFSNEGLWPLCHITHTRPVFRLEDWVQYQEVNQLFADTLIEEMAEETSPLVLVQDYHLALLPFLIKQKRPEAKVALFWHIPWPNPESFGICPWRREILIGMLGADLLGFHIQFFCNNFLDTVDRFMESQIDWETFTIARVGRSTLVKPFPIGIGLNGNNTAQTTSTIESLRREIARSSGVTTEFIGVGVDRIDYTKGIPERFRAIERFFEKYPEFVQRMTFVELGAPSRGHITPYKSLAAEIDQIVERINWTFQTGNWKPIVYLKAHHTHEVINKYYKTADFCMVTSLHDGMNLVAKEFIANQDENGQGVLILSQFAGASRELRDAIIVNPYDIEEMADSIKTAITMDQVSRTERMQRMKDVVKENNVYRWAGKLIGELIRV